jgi:hypothetical protein
MDLENIGFNLRIQSGDASNDDQQHRHHANDDQGELPLANKGDNEGGDESGDGLYEHAELFANPRLYQFTVGCSLHRDRSLNLVKETNLLAERVSNIASQTVGDKGEKGGIYIGARESHNADVNKVEAARVSYRGKWSLGWYCFLRGFLDGGHETIGLRAW